MRANRGLLASALSVALLAFPPPSPAQSVGNRGVFGTAPGTPGAIVGNSGVFGTSPGTPGAQSGNAGTFGSSQIGVIAVPPPTTNTITPIPIGGAAAPSFTGTAAIGSPPTLGGANFSPTGGGSASYCGNGGSNVPCSYFIPPGPGVR